MTRTEFFERIRPWMPDKRFSPDAVKAIDALATEMGIAHAVSPAASTASLDGALALIKRFEGCRLDAYPDPGSGGDPWTVGWGATGPGIKKGVRWTQQQADERLASDVMRFADGVDRLTSDKTRPHQRSALISFAYNVGIGALKESTLLRMHNDGDYAGAAAQFGRWDKAAGKVLAGLTKRRAAEAAVYRGESA